MKTALILPALLLHIQAASGGWQKTVLESEERNGVITHEIDGSERWRSKWTREKLVLDDETVVRFVETGEGLYTSFDEQVRWRMEALWKTEEGFRPHRVEKMFHDEEGTLLLRERKLFDFEKGTVNFERRTSNGDSLQKELKVPSDTLIPEGLGTALRILLFDSNEPSQFHLLSNEPKLYKVRLRFHSKQWIETPVGKFYSHRVEMKPDLGFLNLFGFLVPKTYFWFAVDSPHVWLRYQGLESGRHSPKVVIELSEHEQEPRE